MKLTEAQQEFLDLTSTRVGGPKFNVATSCWSNSKATGYWSDYVCHSTPQALKGLAKRGYITLNLFWRGATVTRIK